MDLDRLGEAILDRARGVSGVAEVYLKRTLWRQVLRRDGVTVTRSSGKEVGCAVRFFLPDGRWGFHFLSDPARGQAREIVVAACDTAAWSTDPVGGVRLPPEPPAGGAALGVPPALPPGEFLGEAERAALAAGERAGVVDRSACADADMEVWLGNGLGMCGAFRRHLRHVVLGLAPSGGGLIFHRRASTGLAELDPEAVGREAALLALGPFRARGKPCVGDSILLHPAAASALVQRVARRFFPGRGGRGAGPAGTRVGGVGFHLIDDGRLAEGIAPAPFDGEGWGTGRKVLVREGRVAARVGPFEAGNRVRDSFRRPPRTGPTNLFIPPDRRGRDEMIRAAHDGILVLRLGRIVPGAGGGGRPGIRVSGCGIAGGVLKGGIPSAVIAGDEESLLLAVRERSSDLTFYPFEGSFGSPTLRLEGVRVLG